MRTPTRSPTPCASRSQPYANGSVNQRSSPPSPASDTASAPNQRTSLTEKRMARAPGLSVRLKLTLSYAGFVMLAGAVLLAAVWLFLLHDLPDVAVSAGGVVPIHSIFRRDFVP